MLIKHFKSFVSVGVVCNQFVTRFILCLKKMLKFVEKISFLHPNILFHQFQVPCWSLDVKVLRKKDFSKWTFEKYIKKMWFGCKYVFLQRPITYLTSFTTLTPYLVYSEFRISLLYAQKCMMNSQWWCHDVIIAI